MTAAAGAIALALLFLPGLALMTLWPGGDGWGLGRRLLAAPGASLAVVAIVFQAAWMAGLRLGAAAVGLTLAGATVIAAIWAIRQVRRPHSRPDVLPAALLAVVLALTVWSRREAVEGLEVPLWWDSVHHTTIVQLLLDNGGVFSSWEPYAPLSTLTYHWGFHALAASLAWLAGLTASMAVLVLGQALNAATVLTAYLLAERLSGKAWAGAAAALVTGLVSLMPAYYVNWGRYTQLAGQLILPVAGVLAIEAVERGGPRRILAAAALAAGLALTHYRVAIFFAAFVGAYALVRAYEVRRDRQRLRLEAGRLAAVAAGTLLLAGPWLWHLAQDMAPRYLSKWSAPLTAAAAEWQAAYNSIRDVDAVLPAYLLWPALAGLAAAMLWRRRAGFLLLLWVEGLFLAANPGWLGLPGAGAVTNHAVLLALYLPASCAIGLLIAGLLDRAPRRYGLAARSRWALAAAALAVGVWGAGETSRVVNPFFQLVTEADLRALDWVREYTPADAAFLVNSERAYGGGTVVGTDAGWWLPLLAKRRSTVPVMVYGTERSEPPGFFERTNEMEETVRTRGPTSVEGIEALRRAGVGYVFIGSRGGYLKADELTGSPDFEALYEADGVAVFRLRVPR